MRDVVIAGGGLAGSATAIHLARRGIAVTVIERSREVGRKACGEGLFPAGVDELQALGLGAPGGTGAELRGVRFQAGHAVAEASFGAGRTALGIRRDVLDAALQKAAARSGVEVCAGVTARGLLLDGGRVAALSSNGDTFEARAFVAADGVGSRLRKSAGLEAPRTGDRYGISAHVRTFVPLEPVVQVSFQRGFELYVTPVGEGEANVALLARRDVMRGFGGRLRDGFVAAVAQHPALSGGFELVDEPLAAGPFARGCSRAWRANLVLVGDAAGFFDGITGEGMSVALQGARLAAAAIAEYLADGSYEALRRYEKQRRELVRNSNLLGRLTLTLGRWPPLAEFAVRNLGRRPETFARLVAVNTGDAELRSVRVRDISALLLGV